MTQPNKKANCDDGIDRISELPVNVIDCILQHLTVKDLTRTSILSTKWRDMWTYVPRLRFDQEFYDLNENLNDSQIPRIITKILSRHNGPIVEFILILFWTPKRKNKTFKYLNKWIRFLSRKGVKHIKLVNHEEYLVQVPSHLFFYHRLTYLHLGKFKLSIPHSFCGLKSLLHLHLEDVTFELGALETLLSGCPLLEKLTVIQCSGCQYIDLSSSSYSPALIDLTLSLPQNFIFGLNKIQRLTLGSLEKMRLYTYIFPLSQLIMNLKYLHLDGANLLDEREELLYIVSVLKSASNLVELDILTCEFGYKAHVPDPSEKLECSSSCLSQLQTVNFVVGSSINHAMSLARFILANSSSLKTLNFYPCFQADAPILSSISQDLLGMERASQRAHVKFVHP